MRATACGRAVRRRCLASRSASRPGGTDLGDPQEPEWKELNCWILLAIGRSNATSCSEMYLLWMPDRALAGARYDDKQRGDRYNVGDIANPALGAQESAVALRALGIEAKTTVANKLQNVSWPGSLRSIARAASARSPGCGRSIPRHCGKSAAVRLPRLGLLPTGPSSAALPSQ